MNDKERLAKFDRLVIIKETVKKLMIEQYGLEKELNIY